MFKWNIQRNRRSPVLQWQPVNQYSLIPKRMIILSLFFLVNQKRTETSVARFPNEWLFWVFFLFYFLHWPVKPDSQTNHYYDLVLFSRPNIDQWSLIPKKILLWAVFSSNIYQWNLIPVWMTLMSWFLLENKNIHHDHCSRIPKWMTLKSLFFLVNQKHTEWPL